ncbi:DUF4019 domain-containing protein [Dyella japonica]|uniref:DUF4019 domain-containing protein n=1 Tax=Dyella japonica TaxID=231455 RepID=A0ABV2K208_9GAMM
MFAKTLLCIFLLMLLVTAHAQHATPTAPLPTSEQNVQSVKQDQEMIAAAIAVAQKVDKNKTGEVWDAASAVAKSVSTRDAFVKQITKDRQSLGTVISRTVTVVTHSQSNGSQSIPAGMYISVHFNTQFSKTKQPVRELVSFHQDADRVWRLAGYSVR